MRKNLSRRGFGTLANHVAEREDAARAVVAPIYMSSTFHFPDAASAGDAFAGRGPGYIYSRYNNPNMEQVAAKIAALEGFDLLRAAPERALDEVVTGRMFSSGMAAAAAVLFSLARAGQAVVAQKALYSASFTLLEEYARSLGIRVTWVERAADPAAWEQAFAATPGAGMAYAETPANPALSLVDLRAVAEIAHRAGARLVVDNTFATPYCQRPLTLGADVVLHSTTKYLCGHGEIIGGAVVSTDRAWVDGPLYSAVKILGGVPSPFDCWLTAIGLKTLELRMERHCANAAAAAAWLERHPKIERVYYPGLASHPDHALARRQMSSYGGMLSFEVKGGLEAGVRLMNGLSLIALAPTLGNTESLIQHPASMSHSAVAPEQRRAMGISDGLVRFSVGIENLHDLLADLETALEQV